MLDKEALAEPELSYGLGGRLYLSHSGWLLLQVPNAVIHGLIAALQEPGVELPRNDHDGQVNAHISVMRPEELETIGGPDKITERGQIFRYTLGPLRSVVPAGWAEMSRVWFVEVRSPQLERLRVTYGLTPRPNENKFQFHITVAVRRKRVLQAGDVVKHSGLGVLNDGWLEDLLQAAEAEHYEDYLAECGPGGIDRGLGSH